MKKKGILSNIILVLVLLIGLSLLLYPSFSEYWNSLHQTKAIANYSEQVAQIESNEYEAYIDAAQEYNKSLLHRYNEYRLTDEQQELYPTLLDVSVDNIMGYIEIPSIDCRLPIYHGTGEAALQAGVGHIDWSSLPIGGVSTHSVLSGHRGLPSAKLFTDLDKINVGDIFMIRVLNELLTYEVDQILIVTPDETEELLIEEGKDFCTLVTCTPYGINSHRILVRGHRIENPKEAVHLRITSDAVQIEPLVVASVLVGPIVIVLLIGVLMNDNRRKRSIKYKRS